MRSSESGFVGIPVSYGQTVLGAVQYRSALFG
jgi:hypothetical protein